MSLPVHLHRHAFVLQKDASLQLLCKRLAGLASPRRAATSPPQSGQALPTPACRTLQPAHLGSLRTVRESPGQSNEFLARKAQAVEDRYGIVLFHRAEQGPAGVGAQRLRVSL